VNGETVDRRDRHLLVGAGFSGLGVAAAFQRHGVPFDIVEADESLGGNWYHGVYETVHIISSRKTTEYADFPMPADWPDFPSAAQMLEYLKSYAEHWKLDEKIELRTRVERVAPLAGDLWEVELAGGERRVYGGVVVANGHHWDKRWPKYPGTFAGELIHSKDYKHPTQLRDKRVLVIGAGNSACDIAVEAARFARSAQISMRRGHWFLPKTMLGVPSVELMKSWMPLSLQRATLKALLRVVVGPYERYGLQHPDHRLFETHPTVNSELLHALRHGNVTPHPDVARWDGDQVEFVDGVREPFDLVVCATGYDVSFPFVAEGVVRWKDGMPQLIGGLLPPDHKNIYFFGVGQPRYGAGPLISAGAETLCTMVDTQRRLRHPLGAVLARLGQKPPKSHLQDPFELLRAARRGRRLLPKLPRIERFVMP
jgi:Flavin-binding monooxygenase-like